MIGLENEALMVWWIVGLLAYFIPTIIAILIIRHYCFSKGQDK